MVERQWPFHCCVIRHSNIPSMDWYFKETNLKQAENASRLYAEMEFAVRQQRLSQAQTILQQMTMIFRSAYQIQSHLSMVKLLWILWTMTMQSFNLNLF